MNSKKILKRLISRESILIFGLIIFNVINLIFFQNNDTLILINSLILLILYFNLSKRDYNDKKIILFSIIHFSFYGVLLESLILRYNNNIFYRNPSKPLNLPLWLIPTYATFCLGSIFTYDFFKIILSN